MNIQTSPPPLTAANASVIERPSREEAEAAVRTLLRWTGDDPDREGLVDTRAIAPSVSPAVAARFLTREGYPDEIESDAEALGTLIAAELVARADAGSRAATQTQDHVSARLR